LRQNARKALLYCFIDDFAQSQSRIRRNALRCLSFLLRGLFGFVVKVKSRDLFFVADNPVMCREVIAASLREGPGGDGPGAFIVLPDPRSILGGQALSRHERMKEAGMTVFLRKMNEKFNRLCTVFGCFFERFPILSLSCHLENIPSQSEKVPDRSKTLLSLSENTISV
jgi:hypothetical protein